MHTEPMKQKKLNCTFSLWPSAVCKVASRSKSSFWRLETFCSYKNMIKYSYISTVIIRRHLSINKISRYSTLLTQRRIAKKYFHVIIVYSNLMYVCMYNNCS